MSKTTHTPEPWEVGTSGTAVTNGKMVICRISDSHLLDEGEAEANTKRIVECVNALKGIDNPSQWVPYAADCTVRIHNFETHIESLKNTNEIANEHITKLKAERDDLNVCTKDMAQHITLIEEINSKVDEDRNVLRVLNTFLKSAFDEFYSKLTEVKTSAEIEDGLGNQVMARQIGELLEKYNLSNQ